MTETCIQHVNRFRTTGSSVVNSQIYYKPFYIGDKRECSSSCPSRVDTGPPTLARSEYSVSCAKYRPALPYIDSVKAVRIALK